MNAASNINKVRSGFTLTELLIALGLMGVILLLVSQALMGSVKDSERIGAYAELLKEAQITQQIISGRIQEAIYIWPSGSEFQLSRSGRTTRNTVQAERPSQLWRVAEQPFLALLLPPQTPQYAAGRPTGCTPHQTEACYRFFAYFPMRRADMLRAFQGAKPPADERNEEQWVLLQYRANLVNAAGAWYPQPHSQAIDPQFLPDAAYYQGKSADFLMDYLAPRSLDIRVEPPTRQQANGSVHMTFYLERHLQHGRLSLGQEPTQRLGGQFIPRNWYGTGP